MMHLERQFSRLIKKIYEMPSFYIQILEGPIRQKMAIYVFHNN